MAQEFSDQAERVFGIWRRRKGLAFLVFSASLAAGATLALSLPNRYRATATVLVERQEVSEAFVRSAVTSGLEARIQTIHHQIMSRARLKDVITGLGLYPELVNQVPFDAIVDRLRRDTELDLQGVQQTYGQRTMIAFTLSYGGRDPESAARVANTLAALYVEENAKNRTRQAARTAEFLRDQLEGSKQELDAIEQRANEFRLRHTGELPDQLAANVAALERLTTQLRLNGEYQLRGIERRQRLEEQLVQTGSPASIPPPAADSPAAELVTLREQLAELRRRFTDQYPGVIRVKAEIAVLEQQLAQASGDGEPDTRADPAVPLERGLRQVDSDLESLKEQEESLRQAIAVYEARIETAPRRQQELQQLLGDYDIAKERYETLLKRYDEAQLAESLEQDHSVEQFQILDPAIPPNAPAAPNRRRLLLVGLLASMALAVGAVMAAERLDTSLHTVDELRAFIDVPTIATIRRIYTEADLRRRRRRVAPMTALGIGALALIVEATHYLASGNELIVQFISQLL